MVAVFKGDAECSKQTNTNNQMKNQKVIDAVLEFIKTNPGSSVEAITVGIKGSDILVRGAIKTLSTDGAIIADQDTGAYSFNSEGKSTQVEQQKVSPASADKKAQQKTSKKEDEDLGPKTITGRDNSKYRFGEERNLPKGRLVLVLVRAYVEKNPKVSLTKLKEIFHSEELQPRFGIIAELSLAKGFSKNRVDRFFVKNSDDIIKLGNGTKIAVCNQWTADGINKLLKIVAAHPIGFKVKVEAAE